MTVEIAEALQLSHLQEGEIACLMPNEQTQWKTFGHGNDRQSNFLEFCEVTWPCRNNSSKVLTRAVLRWEGDFKGVYIHLECVYPKEMGPAIRPLCCIIG